MFTSAICFPDECGELVALSRVGIWFVMLWISIAAILVETPWSETILLLPGWSWNALVPLALQVEFFVCGCPCVTPLCALERVPTGKLLWLAKFHPTQIVLGKFLLTALCHCFKWDVTVTDFVLWSDLRFFSIAGPSLVTIAYDLAGLSVFDWICFCMFCVTLESLFVSSFTFWFWQWVC